MGRNSTLKGKTLIDPNLRFHCGDFCLRTGYYRIYDRDGARTVWRRWVIYGDPMPPLPGRGMHFRWDERFLGLAAA